MMKFMETYKITLDMFTELI